MNTDETSGLPVVAVLDDLAQQLARHDIVILEAPPGAGKTTLVPLSLMQSAWLAQRRIIMLEPRRIATRNAAHRMAALLGEQPGQSVGYRMRLESRVSAATRVEVITEGILTRMLLADPALADIGLVIFDEFHERSLDADTALSLCLHSRELFRDATDPLKLLIMSATLDSAELSQRLDAPVISCSGRQYPVEAVYSRPARPRERIQERVTEATLAALNDNPESSLLVFLPGQGEIRQVATQLKQRVTDADILPLYGDLGMTEQQHAISSLSRKVVLATNIAETSLTIDGVDVVIDAGLAREPVFDPGTGMTRLQLQKISQAASEQRMGRAGRLRPGKCYRLWSRSQQHSMAAQNPAEISNADLAPLALLLLDWGVTDPLELTWIDPPPEGAWAQAIELLETLAAITRTKKTIRLTESGRWMAKLPVHPRLAHLLVEAAQVNQLEEGAWLAATLSDRYPLDHPDITQALDILSGRRPCPPALRGWQQRTLKLANQLSRSTAALGVTSKAIDIAAAELPGYLLACAYPDRVARRRNKGGYQLANGRSAAPASDHALRSDWLAVAEVSGSVRSTGDTIRSTATLNPGLFTGVLASQVQSRVIIEWSKKEDRFIAERHQRVGRLVLGRETLSDITEDMRHSALIRHIRSEGLQRLPWTEDVRQLQARLQLAHQLNDTFPAADDTTLLATLEDWLTPFLQTVTTPRALKRVAISEALHHLLDWQQQRQLDEMLPERIRVPSGSNLRIDYTRSPPVLRVKLQEMFGQMTTPAVAGNRIPLSIELLSPAGRPLQITQDLAGFWQSSYHDVRKDMRGRYPKHPWPEDPLVAVATAKTRHRKP